MNRIKKGLAVVAALAASATLLVGAAQASSAAAPGLRAFGITNDGKLMAMFTTDRPEQLDWVRRITGLVTDTSVIGIDFRVQDGKFYAVGNHGGIYTISLPSGPNPGDVIVTKVSQLTVTLKGKNFGVDFNPAADRLRVISDAGQNLRHNLNDGTTATDATLTSPPITTPTAGVTAAAYTNNDLDGTTATTLFDVNTMTDQVVIQSPANNGLLVPTGALGTDVGPNAGFDIFSDLSNGKTVSNSAFAVGIVPSGDATLFTVDPLTGAATPVGLFPLLITDIAVALDS